MTTDEDTRAVRRAAAQARAALQQKAIYDDTVANAAFAAEAVVILAKEMERSAGRPHITTRLQNVVRRIEEDLGSDRPVLERVRMLLQQEVGQTRDMKKETGSYRKPDG